MKHGAVLSPRRAYRYALWRETGGGEGTVLFVGLNPSTADERYVESEIENVREVHE